MRNYVANCDCIELMEELPENYFDLSITDPPYGLPERSKRGQGKLQNRTIQNMYLKGWDNKPEQRYFDLLFYVSKFQIIWGGNYFNLPPNRGFIIWDKCQPWPNFAACEYAFNSIDGVAKIFKFDNRTGNKIHPTQKPVALYKWLLTNYAKPGQIIFDSHVGSGSSRIACYDMGFEFVGAEVDLEYWQAQEKRFEEHKRQADLFTPKERQEMIYKEQELF